LKELLDQYAVYNNWANHRIADTINSLPIELVDKSVESSFGSIRLTILHLWQADYVWYQRLNLAENIGFPVAEETRPWKDILDDWKQQSFLLKEWVLHAKEANLTHVFAYMNTKREQFKQPVYQVLLQVFNHSTYHRGQLVTILHQLGVEKIAATDFIVWSRGKH
jgi:uncharacterized damage-inducible protein DinB